MEDLVAGDAVVTVSGETATIVWTGRRRLRLDAHPQADRVRPVRIAAHAFAENLPKRDLVLSPGHGVFVDGVLIPASALVNGRTIVQEVVAEVTYLHVELDRHDVLLAEGLPAESYLDVGNRAEFETADGPVTLHPLFVTLAHEAACAPFVIAGPVVDAVRAVGRADRGDHGDTARRLTRRPSGARRSRDPGPGGLQTIPAIPAPAS